LTITLRKINVNVVKLFVQFVKRLLVAQAGSCFSSRSWFVGRAVFLIIRGCGMKRCVVCGGFFVLLFVSVLLFWPPTVFAQAKMVGSDACKGCHEDAYKSYMSSVHGKEYVPGNPAKRDGCESCHGPGSVHVDKGGGKGTIRSFKKTAGGYSGLDEASMRTAACQACHGDSKKTAFWNMGKHKVEGLSCDSCHASHTTAKNNLKAKDPQICYTCHQQVRSQTNKNSHHPISEGFMNCGSCHAPHGGFGPKSIKADSNNELCYKCHADKRGPFMYEHPPVEQNCLNCHSPHGSNNYAMLTAKTSENCQACHNWSRHPGTPYTNYEMFPNNPPGGAKGAASSNRGFGRNCLYCHSKIHGTNGPGSKGQFFLR
jgi:DmsE family decaheme c-type cytochrome